MNTTMRQVSAFLATAAVVVLGLSLLVPFPEAVGGDGTDRPAAPVSFTKDGKLKLPALGSWREWPFLGTPLTPNDLNKGKAAFPEFHHVYMDAVSFKAYQRTGRFPEGTVICKELVTVGTKKASSGRGYFEGEHNGFEIAHKSKRLYPSEPGNWAYYSFGHHAPPYASAAKRQPVANCAACHQGLADEDMVFSQYYPNLRAAKSGK